MADKHNRQSREVLTAGRQAEQLKSLLEISKSLHLYLQLDEQIYCIIKQVQEFVDAEAVSIILPDETNTEFLISWAENMDEQQTARLKGIRFPIEEGIAGRVFKTGKPEVVQNAASDPNHYKLVDTVTGFKTRSVIAIPLQGKRGTIGVLEVLNKRQGVFDDNDRDILMTLCGIIGLALDNARMYTFLDKAYHELKVIDQTKDAWLALAKEESVRLRREVEAHYRFEQIKGKSDRMMAMLHLCERAIDADITVLLEGETGTGKELIARCIHYSGLRRERPFLTQNCGAIPDTLLASELFGHKKGAFTGAFKDKRGIFEIAHQGTIFLDEVGEMSPAMQTSLLRVLQEGEFRPLGAEQGKKVDVRIISATNRGLAADVKAGKFREDLFYRLSVFPISVPPLRDRIGDIPILVQYFLTVFNRKHNWNVKGVDKEAMHFLTAYPFPGNIRELRNEIERAMALVDHSGIIGLEHLSDKIRCNLAMVKYRNHQQGTLKEMVEALERSVLLEFLEKHRGNKTRVANALGLSRFGLMKKMQRYDL